MKNQAFGLKAAALCVVAAGFDLLACPMASEAAALKVQLNFTALTSASGSFAVAKDGKMFTVAAQGGAAGLGELIEFDPPSKTLTVLHSFQGSADGAQPVPGLVLTKSGIIYGATAAGGTANLGTVFKFDTKTGVETVLHSFAGADGQTPQYGPIIASNGMLYGTTSKGGVSNLGIVFQLKPTNGRETVVFNFNGSNGAVPNGLTIDSSGLLYATTAQGGANIYFGNLFTINPVTGVQTILYSFTENLPGSPINSLVLGANGLIYGTASGDGFSFDPANQSMNDLGVYEAGCLPSQLITDAAGNLYGTCYFHGGYGQVYEASVATDTVSILWKFDSSPYPKPWLGDEPDGLAFGKNGKLYGTTLTGGSTYKTNPPGFGNIYSLTP